MQPFVGAEPKHQLQNLRVRGKALSMFHRVDQPRRRHHLKALVEANEKLGRHDCALNGTELRAFDLTWHRAQLARRIDLGLDPAT